MPAPCQERSISCGDIFFCPQNDIGNVRISRKTSRPGSISSGATVIPLPECQKPVRATRTGKRYTHVLLSYIYALFYLFPCRNGGSKNRICDPRMFPIALDARFLWWQRVNPSPSKKESKIRLPNGTLRAGSKVADTVGKQDGFGDLG